ncbi:MAG: ABC transporter permease [Candidatus Rokubacteria bacterium]|nr:ABC transporter permease [Candidatus Rokubacteria bacterium]
MSGGRDPRWPLPLASGLALLGVWEAAWRLGWIDPLFFSGPTAVAAVLARLVATGEILPHYASTMGAVALGLAPAVAAGILLGLVYGASAGVRRVAGPYVAFLNATPRVALIGLFVVWLGLGLGVRVVLVAISAFFPVFFNAAEGVRALGASLDRVGRAYGCTRWERLTRILLPHTLPYALTGTRLAVGRSLVVVVIAEIFVGSLGGVGYFIINAGQQFQSAHVLAGALLMALTGVTLTLGLERVEAWLTPWHPRAGL